MKVTYRLNGNRTVAVEVTFDYETELELFDSTIDKIQVRRAQLETPREPVETLSELQEQIRTALQSSSHGRTTAELAEQLVGSTYMAIRAELLQLYSKGLIEREGLGGRSGYTYRWKS